MEVPEHRALLGVDVVGSAGNEGYHLNAVRDAVDELIRLALPLAGIQDADLVEWESTGDGALLTLANRRLGALLDAAHHLDVLATERNRRRKPDVRLRLAVETGPVGPQPGLYLPKITVTRLLGAQSFKELVVRCPDMNTALIVSDDAFRAVFGGDHTRHVRRGDFASLAVRAKELSTTAWVRVPGYDARSLATPASAPEEPSPQPAVNVVNTVHGAFNGVQAGVINGGVNLGPR